MNVFKIIDPVFKTESLYILNCNQSQLSKYLKTRYNCIADVDEDSLGTMLSYGRSPWRVVWVGKADLSTLIHELFHLVTKICFDRGIPIIAHHPNGTNGDETAAYLLEFFLKECLKRRIIPVHRRTVMGKKMMKKSGKKSC